MAAALLSVGTGPRIAAARCYGLASAGADAGGAALLTATAAALLMERLGLTEDELCRALDVDALALIAGELEDRPQLPILLALTEEAAERAGGGVLRRWLRAAGPRGRPLDHLLARDYTAFEDALALLAERGFVLRGGGGGSG